MMTHMSLRDARANLAELIGRAQDHHERVVLTSHGKPVAVLMGVYDYESLVETLDVLADPEVMASLQQSEKELAEGLSTPLRDSPTSNAA